MIRSDRVVALDTNPDHGTLGRSLAPDHAVFVDDLLGVVDQPALTVAMLDRFLARAPHGMLVLPAPTEPERMDLLDGAAYERVIHRLQEMVNILVLDTEVYSNTGGQASKSTPRGAVAKFAASGKQLAKKDLGLLAIGYGDIYVGRIAMGANDAHTVRTFLEAEAYDGPSLIIAYSVCIAHGYDLRYGLEQQKKAVLSGHWPLYRYDPRLAHNGGRPFQLDSKPPSIPLQDYIYAETRYRMLTQSNPDEAKRLLALAESDIRARWATYEQLARKDDSNGA
jgi:hypothetical protein